MTVSILTSLFAAIFALAQDICRLRPEVGKEVIDYVM
jgi:hypothetical protein